MTGPPAIFAQDLALLFGDRLLTRSYANLPVAPPLFAACPLLAQLAPICLPNMHRTKEGDGVIAGDVRGGIRPGKP